jgi:hypothetical protein
MENSMEGICPCGGRISESRYDVKSAAGLLKHRLAGDPPVTVVVSECAACGRRDTEYLRDGAEVGRG